MEWLGTGSHPKCLLPVSMRENDKHVLGTQLQPLSADKQRQFN